MPSKREQHAAMKVRAMMRIGVGLAVARGWITLDHARAEYRKLVWGAYPPGSDDSVPPTYGLSNAELFELAQKGMAVEDDLDALLEREDEGAPPFIKSMGDA